MRAIFKKVYSLEKRKQYDEALKLIRKELKKRSTPDLKELEIWVLYCSKNYSAAIEVAEKYLKRMRNNFEKASIAGFLSLIHKESGNLDEERNYLDIRIGIHYKILNDPKSKSWQLNKARLNLITDLRFKGDLKSSLKVAKEMEKEFLKRAGDKRSMAAIYDELSKIYKAMAEKLFE